MLGPVKGPGREGRVVYPLVFRPRPLNLKPMGDLTENFSRSEFACPCGCDKADIKMELVRRLQIVRSALDRPLSINSGVRCEEHNSAVGGAEDSAHVAGEAADIRCEDSGLRYNLILRLIFRFDRIGIGRDFIHVDISRSKPKEVLWDYYD